MIGVIDYQAGNTRSVSNALEEIGWKSILSSKQEELDHCQGYILPGVGAASAAMEELRLYGLDRWLRSTQKPVLGICLGMQLLFTESSEGPTSTIGILSGTVQSLEKFSTRVVCIPHMGWNQIQLQQHSPIFAGVNDGAYVYYAHSFGVPFHPATTATTEDFTAAVQYKNYFGVQFHPEKSGRVGLQILKNFGDLCESSQP